MEKSYVDSVMLFERLHRLFLAIVRKDLLELSVVDITAVQALILYNISRQTMKITDIMSNRFYSGSNISYNVKKMLECGYLLSREVGGDRRATHLCLSEKGLKCLEDMENIIGKHVDLLNQKGIEDQYLQALLGRGYGLEAVWQQSFF